MRERGGGRGSSSGGGREQQQQRVQGRSEGIGEKQRRRPAKKGVEEALVSAGEIEVRDIAVVGTGRARARARRGQRK